MSIKKYLSLEEAAKLLKLQPEELIRLREKGDVRGFADRGTWIAFKNRGDLAIAVEGDNRLFNQYGIILVNPEKFPHVKKESGQTFIDWIVSRDGQKAIADYTIGGQQLFSPDARADGS